MNEMRHFLRYVTPGLVFLIELFVIVAIGLSGCGQFDWIISKITSPRIDTGDALTVFFASGAVGYLLNMVYQISIGRWFGLDFRNIAQLILDRKLLDREALGLVGVHNLSNYQGWLVVTTFWHSERGNSKRLRHATQRSGSLADFANGAGSCLIGAWIAATLGFLVLVKLGSLHEYAFATAAVFILLHFVFQQLTRHNNSHFVAGILKKELDENKEKSWRGVIVEESLKNNRILNDLSVVAVRISDDEDPAARWHLYTVNVLRDQIERLAHELKEPKWYMHFWKDRHVIAVFQDKAFEFDYDDKASWQPTIEYGISLGIPHEQLDFPIE